MDLRMFAVAATVLLALASSVPAPVSGQAVTTSCVASLVNSFTPCLGYITNSTKSGGPLPTADCCRCLAAVVNASTSCACLILTGKVPFSLPINWTLAITLPKACNSTSFPLQCKGRSAQHPAPGPVAVSPAMPPLLARIDGRAHRDEAASGASSACRASVGVSVMLAVVGAMLGSGAEPGFRYRGGEP